MPNKKNAKKLIEWYNIMQNEHPEKIEEMEHRKMIRTEKLDGGNIDDDPEIVKIHDYVAKTYEDNMDRMHEGPPVLYIRLQYAKEVTQSRYEASFFSNIVHEADNVMDKITGDDDDDSDFETTVDVDNSGGFMSTMGLKGAEAQPELRVLVLKLVNANKITSNGGKVKAARVSLLYKNEKKNYTSKSTRKDADYMHRVGFQHVFTFRGIPIEKYIDVEIKLSVQVFTETGKHTAFALLSPNGSEFGEVPKSLENKIQAKDTLWLNYLDNASEEIVEFALPLKVGEPSFAKKIVDSVLKKSTNEPEKRKTSRTSLKDLFS